MRLFVISLPLLLTSVWFSAGPVVVPWTGDPYDVGMVNLGMIMICLTVLTVWLFCQCLLFAEDSKKYGEYKRERLMLALSGVTAIMVFYEVLVFARMFFEMGEF